MASFKSAKGTFLFPIELIHLIVDEVDAQTRSNPRSRLGTLCALCHVCRAFYFAARSQVLSTISLHLPDTQERAAALFNVLKSDSSSIQHIQSLTLKFDIRPIAHPPHVTALSANLVSLALQSNSLHHMCFEGNSSKPCSTPYWDQIDDPDLLSAMLNGIHSNPSLQSLKFSNINELPWKVLLSQFKSKSLRTLTLNKIHFEIGVPEDSEGCLPSSEALEKFEVLTLLGRSTIRSIAALPQRIFKLPMSSTNPTFTHLHTLRINTPSRGENRNDVEYFILGLAPTLETLELRIGTVHSGSFHAILFNKLQRLTTFKVYAELESDLLDPFFLPEDLWAVCHFIQCAATLSQLKAIHIGFLFTIVTGSASFAQPHQASNSDFISNTAWKDLDAVLSWSNPGFVALKHISLQIEKYYHCDKASMDGTRIKDADSTNITVSDILPLTCQRLTLLETDFGVYSIYTADSMSELVERWF